MRFVLAALCLVSASPAFALTVVDAKIHAAIIQVKGKGAAPSAPITWEGNVVATSSKSGTFLFTTTDVPTDCVGEVGDGSSTAAAVIAGCAPRDRGLMVVDANGQVLGPFLENPGDDTGLLESVALATNDGAVLAYFQTEGFVVPGATALFYESSDCSGAPLLAVDARPVLHAVGLHDGVLYYRRHTGTSTSLGSFVVLGVDASDCAAQGHVFTPPDRCCCAGALCGPQPATAAPVGTIDVGGFTPPFRVESR